MKHENVERAKIGQYDVYEKRQERIWIKMREMRFVLGSEIVRFSSRSSGKNSRFRGLGNTPTSRKSVSMIIGTLLAKVLRYIPTHCLPICKKYYFNERRDVYERV